MCYIHLKPATKKNNYRIIIIKNFLFKLKIKIKNKNKCNNNKIRKKFQNSKDINKIRCHKKKYF